MSPVWTFYWLSKGWMSQELDLFWVGLWKTASFEKGVRTCRALSVTACSTLTEHVTLFLLGSPSSAALAEQQDTFCSRVQVS
jgi:hypothetical protein